MEKYGTHMAAQVRHYGADVEFYVADYRNGERAMARPLVFDKATDGMIAEPAFRLSLDAAQEFFEMMWSQGFRSKHDTGGADKLDAARKEHITDLRKAAKLA